MRYNLVTLTQRFGKMERWGFMSGLETTNRSAEGGSGSPQPILGLSSPQWSVLSNIITVFSGLGILIAIAGVTLSYRELLSNEKFREIKESLSMISQWEDQGLSSEFDILVQAVIRDIESIRQSSVPISEDIFERLLSQYISEPQNRVTFRRIDRFFNQLGLCVASSVCDETLALSHFRTEIDAWREIYLATEPEMIYSFGTGTTFLIEKNGSTR
jgi:hypothetical protein